MSIRLEDEAGAELQINAWNWGVVHRVVEAADLFPEEVWAPVRFCGELDAEQVATLADDLEHQILPLVGVGQRLLLNGTVTDEPDDGTFYREQSEMWRNYSLHHAVLTKLIAFLRAARGRVKLG